MVETWLKFFTEDIKNDVEKLMAERRKGFFESVLPPVDIVEIDNNLVITADLPGLRKEDINVEISSAYLKIQVNRKIDYGEKSLVHVRQRPERFYKRILLPVNVEEEKATSKYENGVLTVTVPIGKASKIKVE
ncbi:MAG: archaeal heat shock protein Hsp14 [Thermoplasmata archaeon]|jgi:HSP20 family protein|nr:MAG: heat-shock protein Hsp20 [Aciduliprofundum sp.]